MDWFDKWVCILIKRRHERYNVTSVQKAIDILLYEWPVEWTEKHRLARAACLDVIEGRAEPKVAREAFEAAAAEAGILMDFKMPDFSKGRRRR